jgi:hypothetical protein
MSVDWGEAVRDPRHVERVGGAMPDDSVLVH